jgi:type IV pilus assembly protein PilW
VVHAVHGEGQWRQHPDQHAGAPRRRRCQLEPRDQHHAQHLRGRRHPGHLVFRTFVVANGNLQSLDLLASDDTISTNTIGNNIVLLKAFYGKDTSGDGTVDSYDTTTPTTTAGWQQVRTIRLAVVARSAQREKLAVTTANPTLNMGSTVGVAGTADCGTSKCFTLQISPLTGGDTEWQHYRYKVFDTVVPLRNILWSS